MPVAQVVVMIRILGWMDVARLVRGSFLEIKNTVSVMLSIRIRYYRPL
jgi:ABC-type dipeptide/oligopeptide/nickel transport system permease subunit